MSRRRPSRPPLPHVPGVEPRPLPVAAAEPLRIADDERKALLDFAWRRRAIDNRAQLDLAAIEAEERAVFEALAARVDITPGEIGSRYRINPETWTLDATG